MATPRKTAASADPTITAGAKVAPKDYSARTGFGVGEKAKTDLWLVDGKVVTEMKAGQRGTNLAVKGQVVSPARAALIADHSA